MAVLRSEWIVEFADGTEHRVVSDQRDMARWEVQDFAGPGRPFLQSRFVAWSALRRQGAYAKSFDVFNEQDCVETRVDLPDPPDDEDGEGEQGVNP